MQSREWSFAEVAGLYQRHLKDIRCVTTKKSMRGLPDVKHAPRRYAGLISLHRISIETSYEHAPGVFPQGYGFLVPPSGMDEGAANLQLTTQSAG